MGVDCLTSVPEIYDQDPGREWERLVKSPYRALEYRLTKKHLKAHLPPGGRVLDAGGGPGRYSFELCRMGYDVVLLDVSPGLLQYARERLASEDPSVGKHLVDFVLGDIRDLGRFKDAEFDAVLCLGGPLCYLPTVPERMKAMSELTRVAKEGAPVAVSVMGYLAMLRTVLLRAPNELRDVARVDLMKRGDNLVKGVPVHFFELEELCSLAESEGLVTVATVGLQGLSSGLADATNQVAQDEEVWNAWVDLVENTATNPALVSISEHMLYLGTKAAGARRRETF